MSQSVFDRPDRLTPEDLQEPAIDLQRQTTARSYAGHQRSVLIAETLLAGVLVTGFLVSGGTLWLKQLLGGGHSVPQGWLVAAYTAIVFTAYTLVTLPLAWLSAYALPQRYGLSTQSRAGWVEDQLKGLFLGLVLGIPVAEVVFWLLRTYPQTWWLWATLFLIGITVVLGHLSPVLIVPLFYKLVPLVDPGLLSRIRQLADRAGTRIAGLYTINLSSRTRAANALVMGLGSSKRIALGDTLYAHYSEDEIVSIVAHELGHQVRHDLELGIVVQSALLAGGMYLAQTFLAWGVSRFGFSGPGDIAAMPLLMLAIGLFSLITMPLVNGYSRWREKLADRYAVQVTGDPAAFVRAMLRLANQNLAETDPPRWVVWLLYSHPPIGDRVRANL
jgi:STE24 endopeptidase